MRQGWWLGEVERREYGLCKSHTRLLAAMGIWYFTLKVPVSIPVSMVYDPINRRLRVFK